MDVGSAVTRKLGPLPAWAWGLAIGGAVLAMRLVRGGGAGGEPQRILVPSGGGAAMAAPDFVSDLGTAIGRLGDRVAALENPSDPTEQAPPSNSQPGSPSKAANLAAYVMGLRAMFPSVASLFGERQHAGETSAARKERLQRERDFIVERANAPAFDLATYVVGLRKLFPNIATLFPERQTAGESSAARQERLQREREFIESRAGVGVTTTPLAFSTTGIRGFPLSATGPSGRSIRGRGKGI